MNAALDCFQAPIRAWFKSTYGEPTDIQSRAWPVIAQRKHALITAPTGSGKTLTAFLWALQQLITGAWPLGATRVLYVSPMKALNNDIQRNLIDPLEALRAIYESAGESFPNIRVETRSGDTPAEDRRRMAKHPPEILITTPESLNLLHSSPKTRFVLSGIETVILDEIHALADTKRGVHLFTAIERLLLYNDEFQRIALSATVKPLDAVAELVGGYRNLTAISPTRVLDCEAEYERRPVEIVTSTQPKTYELSVRYPGVLNEAEDGAARWPALAEALKGILNRNKSTLVFTNTRRHCERISLLLNDEEERLRVYAHHGSLSREIRTVVERRLKAGELDGIVATNSLELGIDIGALDSVVLVQTPLSVASTLQRLGRAGHRVGETSRGVLFPLFGRDILEAAVMSQAIQARDIETLHPVCNALDVLAQVILSMTGVEPWHVDALFASIRCTTSYQTLRREEFDLVLAMLRGRYEGTRIRALQPLLSIDPDTNMITAKAHALRTIYSSGGTIPDRGYFNLRLSDSNAKVGELDEEFVWERHLGETFTLGNRTWKIQSITHNDVFVTPNEGEPKQVPFWKADAFSRRFQFSDRTACFLEAIEPRLGSPKLKSELQRDCALDSDAADALIDFLTRQRDATGLPHRHHLVIERCTDTRRDTERTQLILHTLWGGAVNRPLSLALAQAWEDRHGDAAEVFANNDCIVFVLPDGETDVDVFELLDGVNIEALLRRRLEQTGLFGARFRENAARALLLPRQTFGKRMPLWMNRLRSKKLLDAVAGYEDFPILIETWRTCLQDEFELDQAKSLLGEVRDGIIKTSTVLTQIPSPFAAEIVWDQTNKFMYESDAQPGPLQSKLREDLFETVVHSQDLRPQLNPELCRVFTLKAQRIYPGYAPAPGGDLREWITERLFLSHEEFDDLVAAVARDHGDSEEQVRNSVSVVETIPGVTTKEARDRLRTAQADSQDANTIEQWLAEWLRFYGPVERASLYDRLPISPEQIDESIASLIELRTVVIGHLNIGAESEQICDAENIEILLRLSRRDAQPEFRPRPVHDLPYFIAHMQGLAGETENVLDAIDLLLGLPIAPATLERDVLPARIHNFKTADLDEAANTILWVGQPDKRVYLSAVETLDLFQEDSPEASEETVALLPSSIGRYTFTELLDHSGRPSTELTEELWAAVWEGRITNDHFGALRSGIATKFKAKPLAADRSRRSRRSGFRAWKATRPFEGHWRAVPQADAPADELDALERSKDRVRLLLDRYGVLFRALLQNERPPLRWGNLFRAIRLMELSAELHCGQFFEDIDSLQVIAAHTLKAFQSNWQTDAMYWMNAADPASLCGVDIPKLKAQLPKRLKTNHLVFHGAELKLVSEGNGRTLRIACPVGDPNLPAYFIVFQAQLTRSASPRSAINIETINGEPATQSPYLDAFRECFEVHTDPKRVTLYKKR